MTLKKFDFFRIGKIYWSGEKDNTDNKKESV